MQAALPELRAWGTELVGVTPSAPPALEAALRREPRPFPVVCDPDRTAYRALGLGRGSWWMFARPGVLRRYLARILRGWFPRRPTSGEDLLQLGGDFVFDRRYCLVYEHRGRDATDRPPLTELLAAVRAATRGGAAENSDS